MSKNLPESIEWIRLLAGPAPAPRGVCLFIDETGVWHLLADRAGQGAGLLHATGRSLEPLSRNPDLLPDEPGLLSPHVVRHGMRYVLAAGRGDGEIVLSVTSDPYAWPEAPSLAFTEEGAADPFLLPGRGEVWSCYYAGPDPEDPALGAICVRTGQNLKNWSGPKRVYVDPPREHTPGSAALRLPSIWREGRQWRLMLEATPEDATARQTRVLTSQQPERFAWGDKPVLASWADVPCPRLATRGTKLYLLRVGSDGGDGWTVELGRL